MRKVGFLITLLCSLKALAQYSTPGLYKWRVHLPYNSNTSIALNQNTFYVGSNSGLFTCDREEGSVEVLSRVSGLSDVEVSKIAFDELSQTLVIVYKNTNIDLLQGGKIYNLPSILNQSIIGEKIINDISIYNQIAYLACSFGIVKIDLRKRQIIDSYQNIGPGGANLNVLDLAIYNQKIYASSESGLFSANVNSPNLSDFAFWNQVNTLTCNQLITFDQLLYVGVNNQLYQYNGIDLDSIQGVSLNEPIVNLKVSQQSVLAVSIRRIARLKQGVLTKYIDILGARDAELDANLNFVAIIDNQGLVFLEPDGYKYIAPAGPIGSTCQRFSYAAQNKLLFAAGGFADGYDGGAGWAPTYNNNKYYVFNGQEWLNAKQLNNDNVNKCADFCDVICDANNKTYLCSFGAGVLEVNGTTPGVLYDTSNSKLGFFVNEFPNYRPVFASGNTIDERGYLWTTCYGAAKPLSVKLPDGRWFDFKFNGGNANVGRITADNASPYNNKWITNTKGGGLYVYNEGANLASENDDRFTILTTEKGKGALPSKNVLCITLDNEGEMWIGTDKGLCIISDPTAVFNNRNYDARQIIFNTGSFNSIFLGSEPILCIKVDGANRKWIGTHNGVWLVSPDGYTVIRNFRTTNSPLLSNSVYDIGIFEETGEVFFATQKGIISYSGDATKADDKHKQVVVYPNPVEPGYTGEIAIRGLANDTDVKITDIAGNLVYETKANGGMATWNGLTFNGNRAATGVYLIYSCNDDVTETYVTKLLFIN